MSSLDRLPQRALFKTAQDIAQVSLELKAAQRTTGQGGQLGYLIQSDQVWDLIETLPTTSGPAYESATYSVTYASNGTQPFPIAIPSTDMRVNGETETHRLSVVPSSGLYVYTDDDGEVLVQTFELPDADYFESPEQSAWRIDILYRGAVTLRFKARANATSDGTLSIARTA